MKLRRRPRFASLASICGAVLVCACAWLASHAQFAAATELERDGYYWYVPEHEKYSRTEFFSQPDFKSGQIRITRTQRFRFVTAHRGWALLEFDGRQAFIHLRLLRVLLWDPAAVDPWYEFKRASVFPEEPAKIEARLKPVRTEPATADSKVPVWKRYKEGWGINKGRSQPSAMGSDGESSAPTPAPEKKRNKYPLLPPIGSQPQADNSEQPAQNEAR